MQTLTAEQQQAAELWLAFHKIDPSERTNFLKNCLESEIESLEGFIVYCHDNTHNMKHASMADHDLALLKQAHNSLECCYN